MPEHELARLINERRQVNGESFEAIAERGGEHLSKSYVHKLTTSTQPPMPKPEQITALAVALELPENVVLRAAEQAAGYHVYEETLPGTDTQVLIANMEQLSPEQRQKLLALVRSMLGNV